MDRINGSGWVDIGGGKRGFADENLATGTEGTELPADFLIDIQEELVAGLIEDLGLVPTLGNQTQVRRAIRRMAAANTNGGAVITASQALTADDAGIVVVSAAAGNINLTLPLASAANGRPLRFTIVRIDATANTVTVALSGTDTAWPGGTLPLVTSAYPLVLHGDGVSRWLALGGGGRLLNIRVFTATGTYNATPGTNWVDVEVQGAAGASAGSPATGAGQVSAGGGGGSGAWARKRIFSGFSGVTVTVGTGGVPTLGGNGGNGGATSFGALVAANGGSGGTIVGPSLTSTIWAAGGAGGPAGSSGDLNIPGLAGAPSYVISSQGIILPAVYGMYGPGPGSGGATTSNPNNAAAQMGVAGKDGILIVKEYA
ncbi:MAG: hypothetical protein ACJ8AW_01500 [Rhodopila sp.]